MWCCESGTSFSSILTLPFDNCIQQWAYMVPRRLLHNWFSSPLLTSFGGDHVEMKLSLFCFVEAVAWSLLLLALWSRAASCVWVGGDIHDSDLHCPSDGCWQCGGQLISTSLVRVPYPIACVGTPPEMVGDWLDPWKEVTTVLLRCLFS